MVFGTYGFDKYILYIIYIIIYIHTHIFGQTATTSSNLTLSICFSREAKHGLNLGCWSIVYAGYMYISNTDPFFWFHFGTTSWTLDSQLESSMWVDCNFGQHKLSHLLRVLWNLKKVPEYSRLGRSKNSLFYDCKHCLEPFVTPNQWEDPFAKGAFSSFIQDSWWTGGFLHLWNTELVVVLTGAQILKKIYLHSM